MNQDAYQPGDGERPEENTAPEAASIAHDEPATDSTLIGFGEVIRRSFAETRGRLGLVGAILVAFASITAVMVFGMSALVGTGIVVGLNSVAGGVALMVLGLVFFVIAIIAYIAAGTALMRVAVDRHMEIGYWESVRWALAHIWPIIVIGLFIQLTTATGYALLIIPGIALAGYTAFSYFAFIKEGTRGTTALIRSIDLVYGRWWAVFLRVLTLSLIAMLTIVVPMVLLGMLADVAPIVGGVLIAFFLAAAYPFAIVWIVFAMTLIFESLRALRPSERFDPGAYKTVRTILIIAAIIGVPILIVWNVVSLSGELESEAPSADELDVLPFEFDAQ